MILIAILIPPLSFLLRGKIFAFIVSSILYVFGFFIYVFFGAGFMLHVGLAVWAVISRVNAKNDKKMKDMERRIIANQNSRDN
ncbi:MAG: YqaE/Pmp3 family membrane protein [Bacteroidia bacterium]